MPESKVAAGCNCRYLSNEATCVACASRLQDELEPDRFDTTDSNDDACQLCGDAVQLPNVESEPEVQTVEIDCFAPGHPVQACPMCTWLHQFETNGACLFCRDRPGTHYFEIEFPVGAAKLEGASIDGTLCSECAHTFGTLAIQRTEPKSATPLPANPAPDGGVFGDPESGGDG